MPRTAHGRRKSAPRSNGGRKSTSHQPLQFLVLEVAGQTANEWNSTHVDLPLLNIQHNYNSMEFYKVEIYSQAVTPTLIAIGSRDLKGVVDASYKMSDMLRDKSFFYQTQIGIGNPTGAVSGSSSTTPISAQSFDLTQGTGQGLFYPAQRIYFNVYQSQAEGGSDLTELVAVKLYYKLHTLSATEQLAMINQYIVTPLD